MGHRNSKAKKASAPEIGNKRKARQNKKNPKKNAATDDQKPVSGKKAGSDEPENTDSYVRMSQAQRAALLNISKRRGISTEDLENMAVEQFGVQFDNLSNRDASSLIRTLQQAA
jgi:hypothetical protein